MDNLKAIVYLVGGILSAAFAMSIPGSGLVAPSHSRAVFAAAMAAGAIFNALAVRELYLKWWRH